jgi:hypothetical protein
LQLDQVLFVVGLVDDGASVLEAEPGVVQEVVDGGLVVGPVEVRTQHHLLNGDLLEPGLELGVIHAVFMEVLILRILRTSLVVEVETGVDWRMPITLEG